MLAHRVHDPRLHRPRRIEAPRERLRQVAGVHALQASAAAAVALALGVLAIALLAPAPRQAPSRDEAAIAAVSPALSSPAAVEEFASGGGDGRAGFRIDATGHFAARAEVLDGLHATLRLDLGGQEWLLPLGEARIYGLPRGTADLSSLQGAHTVIRGSCPAGVSLPDARCVAQWLHVQFSGGGPARPLVAPAAGSEA